MKHRRRFDTYYGAKFARDEKDRPTDWLILPAGPGWFRLEYIGGLKNDQPKAV